MVARAEALTSLGRGAEADAVIAEARADLRTRASRIGDPALRRSFLRRIRAHVRLLGRRREEKRLRS
jgi:eukaryotic-like serine/threonine-protein kinase